MALMDNPNYKYLVSQRLNVLADIGAYFLRNYDRELRDGMMTNLVERLDKIDANLRVYEETAR